jgi:hypothetical protein
MKRAFLLLFTATTMLAGAACAGRATLGPLDDETGTSSSGSGAGGSGGTSSNGGMGGMGSTTTTTTNTTSTSTTTTTTGPTTCDMSGDCGACADCSIQGPCSPLFQACQANPDCNAFGDCLNNCGGQQGCFPSCAQMFPNGVQDYIAAIQCVLCDECASDCAGQAPPMLCDF